MRVENLDQQSAVLQAVLGPVDAQALAAWLPQGSPEQAKLWKRGLQAYRANGQALAERALAAAYPVLAELIGEDNFAPLARHFWAQHPPHRGDMACWGSALADFIEALPQLADEPYLADVARLEWCIHLAASASDVEVDLPSFTLLASTDPAQARLVVGPGVVLLVSEYPVASIVNAHLLGSPSLQQAGHLLAAGCAEHVLVWRQGLRPAVRVSSSAEFLLLQRLLAGDALLDALIASAASDNDAAEEFDFNGWLADAVQKGLICSVELLPITERTI